MAVPLRVGRQVRLRNEFAGCFMSMEGFCDGNARKARFRLLDGETSGGSDEVPHVPTDQMFQIVAVGDHPSQILFTGSWNSAVAALRGKGRVDLDLQKIAAAPRLLASKLETLNLKDVSLDQLKDMMSKMLTSDSRISGVVAAFEPGRFNPEVDHLAQYVGRDLTDPSVFRHAELTPDKGYTPLYREWEWYRFPKANDTSFWADPYLDSGGGNVPMISYSVPVRQNGQFVGVVKMDIELDIESSPALSKPIDSNDSENADGSDAADDDASTRKKIEQVLEALVVGPASAAAKMAVVPVVDEEVVKSTLTEILNGQFKSVLGACLAFERGQSKVPGSGQRYALYARKEKVTGDVIFQLLPPSENYFESSWFRDTLASGNGSWGPIVDDPEHKGEKLISYTVPFSVKGGVKHCGVIRLDVQYDASLKTQVDNVDKNKTVYCTACDLEVPLCYFTNGVTLNKICICLRDFVDGIVSWGTTESDYVKVETRAYQEYAEQYRKSRDIVFGQVIQLVHSKVGRFLSVTLKDQEGVDPNSGNRQFYQVELENDLLLSDPYLEGTENSWFTILPASDAKALGEKVMEGDQCRLLSTRWQWDVRFPETDADRIMDVMPDQKAVGSPRNQAAAEPVQKYVLSSPLNWKLMACGETDEEILNRIKQKALSKAANDLLAKEDASKRSIGNAASAANAQAQRDDKEAKAAANAANLDFGLLQSPSTLSPFVRNWDMVYLRHSTTSNCLAVSALFHPKGQDKVVQGQDKVKEDPESKFVYYGRYSYNLEVHEENRGTAVWRIEIPTPTDPDARAQMARGEYDDTCTVVTWGMVVRLRHLASTRFLCMSTKGVNVDEKTQMGPVGQFAASTCTPEKVLDDEFRITGHKWEPFESDEHILCRFVPVNSAAEPDDAVTVNSPFYIQLLPNTRSAKFMAKEYWLNLAGHTATWTSYRDEEDVFSIRKGTLTEQKAVYQSREYFKNIDFGISYLYESWDKYPRPADDKTARPDKPKEWVNLFASDKRTVDNFNAMTQFIKFCQNYVIMAGNSATADPEGMLNDARNYERESNTGFCLRFRQELALRANVLGRVFSILTHPLFAELVKFQSSRSTKEDDDEDEKKSVVEGLQGDKKNRGNLSAAAEKAAELEEERGKNRELALDCFRECSRFGALLMVDYPEAAIELARVPSNLDFLVRMVYPSSVHQLGVSLWLSLVFENGRDRKVGLTLTPEHLNECMRTWDSILRRRQKLQRAREKALSRRFSPSVWRAIAQRDEELFKTQETFVRFLCALCHSVGIPDSISQKRLLDAFVKQAKVYRLGADGQPIFDQDSSADRNSVTSGATSNASSSRDNHSHVSHEDEKAIQAKIPKPVETAPTVLRLLAGIVLGASRTAGHGILSLTKELVATTGLHDLDLSFGPLLKRTKDASLSPAVRQRYCQMLHRLYFDRMYPRRLVNYTPFTPGSGKDQKLVNPSQFLAQQTKERSRRASQVMAHDLAASVFKVGKVEVTAVWGFILEYLSQCGPHSEMNGCTLAVLAMTRSLIELDFEDIDEDRKDDDVGLFGIGPGSKLSELATQLFTILKTKQHNDRGLGAIAWIVEQLKFRDIKLEICKLFNSLFDYRLNQQMNSFLSLRASGVEGVVAEPGDDTLRFEGQANKADVPLVDLSQPRSDEWFKNRIPGFGSREHNNVEALVFSERNRLLTSDFLKLEPVLLEVVEAWDDSSLVMSCFSLILRQYSQRASLMQSLRRCRFLQSQDDLGRAQKILFDKVDLTYLFRLELESKEWTEVDVPVLINKIPEVIRLLRSMMGQFIAEKDVPQDVGVLVTFERGQSDVSVPGMVETTVVQPSPFCKTAQHIFRLFGVHKLLISLLHIPMPPNCKALRDIYELVYNILAMWSYNNPQNIKKLERFMPLFFSQSTYGPGATLLLTSIIADNYEVACRVPTQFLDEYLQYLGFPLNPTAEQVMKLRSGRSPAVWWNFTSSFDHSWKRSAVSLQFLKGLVRCSGRVVKSNQSLVVKAICENVHILGLLAELEQDDKFAEFCKVLNFAVPLAQSFQIGKIVGKDMKVAGLTVHNLPNALEEKKGGASPAEASKQREVQSALLKKQYYLELVSVLTRCAPCKYVYEQDRAKRESEESSLLCRAALPMKSLINVLVTLTDACAKIPMLRLFEQVYSSEMSSLNPRLKMRLLRSLASSVEEVCGHLEVTLGTGGVRKTVAASPKDVTRVSNYDYIYVFDVVLPFFVGFYHSSFRVSTASRDEVDLSNDVFDNVVSLTKFALEYRTRDGDEAAPAISAMHKNVAAARGSFSMDTVNSRIMLGGFSLDNALNCLMHMADPSGSGLFRDTVEGVMGTQKQEEFIAFFKKLQGTVQLEQDKSSADFEESKNKRVETPMERWVRHNRNALVSGARKDMTDFFTFIAAQNTNRVALRKLILLVGEFAQDQDQRKGTGNEWVDENASRFCVAYLQALQHLVDIDPDDSTRELLIELGICRVLMNLIGRSNSLRVKKASFALANAMLASGLNSQSAFQSTYLSQGSNQFFIRLRDLMATPLGIRTKQEVKVYGVGQTPERFGSWSLMSTMLRFVQALCEGHNFQWQMLLSHQSLGGSGDDLTVSGQIQVGISVNVVTELCEFFGHLMYSHGPLWYVLVYWDRWYTMDVIAKVLTASNKLFNSIIEVQQGPCPANQLELTRGRFIESVNWLLDALLTAELSKMKTSERGNHYGTWSVKDENDEEDATVGRQDTFLELQGLIVTTLNSMLEGNVVAAIPRRILAVLNFGLVQQLMEIYLMRFEEGTDQDDPDLEDPFAVVCIGYYIFTRNLISRWESSGCTGQYSPSFSSLLKSNVYQNCLARFESMVGSVELLREGRVEEVLFRIPGIVQEQSETPTFKESCQSLVYSVRRDNQPSKLDDFLSQSEELIYELTSFPRLKASWLVRRSTFFTNATFFLAVVLNIFAMIPAFTNDGSDDTRFYQFTRPESLITWLFGILQSLFAVCRVVAYAAAHIPNAMFKYTKGNVNWFNETEGHFAYLITAYRWGCFYTAFFFSPFTLYQVLYVAFSIVAQNYHAFYAYHLFDLVGRSNQLREVFASLGAYGSTLGVTALLWIILVYAFVVWGYLGFPDDFRNAIGQGNMGIPGNNLSGSCYSPWECFIYHLSFALRQGGGIGDTLVPMGQFWDTDLSHFYYRAIYDLMFFIICVVVMTAIVTGIIIDAFGASRDHRKEVEEDQNGLCFICGIEGSRFETKRPRDKNDTRHYGFGWHLEHEHNQWHYIYFLAYLSLKDPNEYTGSESYVAKLVREKQTDFFPMDRALMLES